MEQCMKLDLVFEINYTVNITKIIKRVAETSLDIPAESVFVNTDNLNEVIDRIKDEICWDIGFVEGMNTDKAKNQVRDYLIHNKKSVIKIWTNTQNYNKLKLI